MHMGLNISLCKGDLPGNEGIKTKYIDITVPLASHSLNQLLFESKALFCFSNLWNIT